MTVNGWPASNDVARRTDVPFRSARLRIAYLFASSRRVSTFPPSEAEKAFGLVEEYHHALPPPRMPFAYGASDLFVGPSRPEEAYGLPVLRALFCGIPCLLSDTLRHRAIARDATFSFADGDPETIQQAFTGSLAETS